MTKMPWPVVPIKFCEHLEGKKPSQITPAMLRKLSVGGQMHHCAARAFEAMKVAAKADGVVLAPTSAGDTFRSIETQTKGFLTRYQKEVIPDATTRTWNGVKWYLKKGNAPLAAPNDDAKTCSRHMLGIAIDIANTGNKKIMDWLLANEQKFGFSHEVVDMPGAESWHIRFTEGKAMPQAVLDYEATLPPQA
jgi:LAS superfamily LD-carboxypeptidase LdcB